MFDLERRQLIFDLLNKDKSVSVSHLSKTLFVSEATIRRDLQKIEKLGLVKRTYGGAVLIDGLNSEIPLVIRETEHKDQKQFIAQAAAGLIKDGDTLIMDSSTTVLKMVRFLNHFSNLTVITNGAKTAIDLGELHTKVYCTGGRFRENSLSYIGQQAHNCLEGFFADIVFFSCRSVSKEHGLMDSNEDEAVLRRIMIKNSKSAALLCDSSKFDKTSFVKICGFDRIDYLITDQILDEEWTCRLESEGVKIVTVK